MRSGLFSASIYTHHFVADIAGFSVVIDIIPVAVKAVDCEILALVDRINDIIVRFLGRGAPDLAGLDIDIALG